MPSALAFVAGGLLSGIGKGLVLTGKQKYERAMKRFEQEGAQKRALELEGVKQEGRRGLLDAGNVAAMERLGLNIGSRENLASVATESRETLASQATASRESIAAEASTSRERIGAAANRSREKAAEIAAGKATDSSAAEKRAFDNLVKIHTETDLDGIETTDWNAVADGLEGKGFGKLAKAARSRGNAIIEADDLKRATEQAAAELKDKTGFFFDDLDEDGGSPTRFHARRVRELQKEFAEARSTKTSAATAPAALEAEAGPGTKEEPEFSLSNPGPPRKAEDGMWYSKIGPGPKDWARVPAPTKRRRGRGRIPSK